jgi:two-component sensor histidine kinase
MLIYQDNGPGLPENFEIGKSRSLGMRLVQQLTRQLNGEIKYSFENGAKFLITFEDSGTRKKIA